MEGTYFDASDIAEAPAREVLDEGIYHVQIVKATTGESQNKKTPFIEIVGKVVEDAPMQMNDSTPKGRDLFYTLYFSRAGSGQNAAISKRSLMDLFGQVKLDPPEDGRFDLTQLIGREVFYIVKQETYEGQVRARVNATKAINV
jgi:hypothetical protein